MAIQALLMSEINEVSGAGWTDPSCKNAVAGGTVGGAIAGLSGGWVGVVLGAIGGAFAGASGGGCFDNGVPRGLNPPRNMQQ